MVRFLDPEIVEKVDKSFMDKMQKTRDQSNHSRLRKLPENCKIRIWPIFVSFFDVFSVWDDRIDF